MSDGTAITIVVAPRELTDLVYRCARTAGVHVGIAKMLAGRWTEAAIAVADTGPGEAARHGVAVNRAAFDCLAHAAEVFLVSEQLLDQISESSPERTVPTSGPAS